MNNLEKKNLCLDIMNAENCTEVVNILKNANLWDDKLLWRNYGDKQGSWATINNQGNPEFALTEKITNSVDAVLMNQCFESGLHPKSQDDKLPKTTRDAVHKYFENKEDLKKYDLDKTLFDLDEVAGLQEYWDDKKVRKVAENINLSVGGNKSAHPKIAIADKGEGQTPEKLPETIMSLHTGNKKSITFAQGKWNQGGAGSILHCGQDSGIALQFVLTRRNPKILELFSQEKTPLDSNWSFTILRRNKPVKDGEVSEAVYLCPESKVINFESKEMPIFPDKDKQFCKNSDYGTLIILFEYKLATSSAIFGSSALYRQLDAQLPKLPLPVRLYETRKRMQTDSEQTITLRGFSNFQENQYIKGKGDKLEDISPRRGFIRCQNYKIIYDIFCFKKDKGATYIPKNAGLLWTINGQTHAISKNNFFAIDKLSFDEIKDDLLIVVDCSSIKNADREDFFKSSRDRLNNDFQLYKDIRENLISDLSQHTSLQELIQKRIDETVKEEKITDDETIEELQKLLQDLPDEEKDFLPEGFQLKKKKEVQIESGDLNLPKFKFPTFFVFEELKKEKVEIQKIDLEVEIGKVFSIKMFTDAETDYFERKNSPGKLQAIWNLNGSNVEPENFTGPFLKPHGLCSISRITLPANVKPGEIINLEIIVTDKSNKEGFKLLASVFIKHEQKKLHIKKDKKDKTEKKEKIPPEGGQGVNTVEEVIQNPIIAQYVSPDEWKKLTGKDVDGDDVLHVQKNKKGDQTIYRLYLNRTNINLLAELKKKDMKYSEKIIETKYKMGISLIAMFSLMQYRKDLRRNKLFKLEGDIAENSEPKTLDDKTIIQIAARNAGKGLFILSNYLESIGKVKIKNKLSNQDIDA